MTRLPFTALLVAAALVAGSAGGAVAGATITGAQIKDGTIASVDVKDRTLAVRDLAPTAVASLRTARAWAHVGPDGTVESSSPGVTASTSQPGVYCVAAPGLPRPSPAVLTPDFTSDETLTGTNQPQTVLEIGAVSACGASAAVAVVVLTRTWAGNGSTTLSYGTAGFYVVIP